MTNSQISADMVVGCTTPLQTKHRAIKLFVLHIYMEACACMYVDENLRKPRKHLAIGILFLYNKNPYLNI